MRTRFAPSPTGYLHIGGVRTALFNWLLAKQTGGQFILRVDDTDQLRNLHDALEPILSGFRWLGLDWDEGPEVGGPHVYFQSQRAERYQQAVDQLLQSGAAYRDFSRPEELQQERDEAEKAKRDFVYSRRFMAETAEQQQQWVSEGRTSVVRLKMPRQGECRFTDLIRGDVSFAWAKEQDHVIQRADGTCLYHLASVVDDFDMQITHVVRAEEHLSNTPRQIFIAQALGYPLPEFAHLPYVAEPGSKTKMSKRKIDKYLKQRDFKQLHDMGLEIARRIGADTAPENFNPVAVNFYRTIGFLPDAVTNYLLLLGWALDDSTEFFTRDEMVRAFSLERVVKSPASFDPAKLLAFQQRYMSQLSLAQKTEMCLPFLQRSGLMPQAPHEADEAYLQRVIQAASERIVIAGDILKFDEFFVADHQLGYDQNAFEKRIIQSPSAAHYLAEFVKILVTTDDFTAAELQHRFELFVQNLGIKVSELIHSLRVALTGKSTGVGMYEAMELLGPRRCEARILRAVELAGARQSTV